MKTLFVVDDYIIDPLGTAWLSSYLKEAGHEVDIVKVKREDPIDKVRRYNPDMLCYSVTTGKHTFYRNLNWELQRTLPSRVAVFGGPHVTFFPEYAKEADDLCGVRGEGFDTLVDIANCVENAGALSVIPNTVFGEHVNPLRPLKDKANLLHPDRELIYSYPENYYNPIKNVMCSFGCPSSCNYCYNQGYRELYEGGTLQIRPVADIIDEIEQLQDYPLEMVFMQDDIFPLYDNDWLSEFCAGYKIVRVPFHIQSRVEFLVDDPIRRLKEVGLHSVTFAIESGNQGLRRDILQRYTTDGTIIRAANLLHKYGIKFRTENMVGIPRETWNTAMETLDLNIRCNPTIAWASLYQPYPGTKLGDRCIENGMFDGDFDSISASFFDTYRLSVPHGRRYERLQKLFSVVVEYPVLRNWIRFLTGLPLNRLYKYIYTKFKRHAYDSKLYSVDS